MLRRIRRPAAVLLLALGALSLASCLSAEERDYVRYDEGKDEFRMLMLLTDIKAKEAEDVDFLEAFYKNRDHVIAPAIPGAANVFPLFAFSVIRMSDKEFAPVNLFSQRPSSLDKSESVVPLSSITVTPGAFFLENGKLGYYQAATVSGKTIDLALDEAAKAMQSDDLAQSVQKELDRRAGGGKVYSWAQVQEKMLEGITLTEKPATEPAGDATQPAEDPISLEKALSKESLENMVKAAKEKKLAIKRVKTAMALTLPLSAADSEGVTTLVKAAMTKVDTLAETPQTAENLDKLLGFKLAKEVGKVAKLTTGSEGLTLAVNLLDFAKAAGGLAGKRIDMNDKKEGEGVDVVAGLKGKQVAIDETLTADAVLKAFEAGTLKGNPSATPVKPGEGIVKAPTP